MGRVLGIVYRVIATHLIKKAGFTRRTARTGAVTLIQRFGGALNLNVHLHMLFLDGVYIEGRDGSLERFRWVKAPTGDALARSVPLIDPLAQSEFQIPVLAASPGLFEAVRTELATGRIFENRPIISPHR